MNCFKTKFGYLHTYENRVVHSLNQVNTDQNELCEYTELKNWTRDLIIVTFLFIAVLIYGVVISESGLIIMGLVLSILGGSIHLILRFFSYEAILDRASIDSVRIGSLIPLISGRGIIFKLNSKSRFRFYWVPMNHLSGKVFIDLDNAERILKDEKLIK